MLWKNTSLKINKKQLIKRINYKLTSNFYSFEEIQHLNKKQLFKIIKLISKIDQVKLSRKEIKDIVVYLQSNLTQISMNTSKLWSFVKSLDVSTKKMVSRFYQIIQHFFYKSYRKDKFELMHN